MTDRRLCQDDRESLGSISSVLITVKQDQDQDQRRIFHDLFQMLPKENQDSLHEAHKTYYQSSRKHTTTLTKLSSMKSNLHRAFAGRVHPTLQQYYTESNGVDSLRAHLADNDPISNWETKTSDRGNIDSCQITTWFPSDDRPAFYIPHDASYDTLSYQKLHQDINACPRFQDSLTVAAVLLPLECMAEMAVVLLSVMAQAVAAPLDPHMSPMRIREAMNQLGCSSIVSTESLLYDLGCRKSEDSFCFCEEDDNGSRAMMDRLDELRIIEPTGGGGLAWSIFRKESGMQGSNVRWDRQLPLAGEGNQQVTYNRKSDADEPVLLLRTSGTTSTPKVVPLTSSMLLYNAICIAASLGLTRNDIDCNAMPLYHIGGIACALLSVLVSGSAAILTGPFEASGFLDLILDSSSRGVSPTWYYGVPTMHKALLLIATSCHGAAIDGNGSLPNKLRFIRSGAAHLSHDVALQLSQVFGTKVIPTYSMSECMPICSSDYPIDYRQPPPTGILDTVGCPIGPSLRIMDERGDTLPHGTDGVGEVAIRGAGVMHEYLFCDEENVSGTNVEGWLRTGDIGTMHPDGRVFLKGRTKEVIKRGGEQVWPNQIDEVIEKVTGVSIAVAFGVPNELWGEEVAVAVVLEEDMQGKDMEMTDKILSTCHEQLDDAYVPCQIIFLPSSDLLLRGPTGKYIRSKMAAHLSITAVDEAALHALQSLATVNPNSETPCNRAVPSSALNGIRFLTACFVVQVHIGLYPNIGWLKVQSFTVNMIIFFGLGAFQLTCSVASSVKDKWASFVGTKIGAMHALFVVTQLIALPAYLLFMCGNGGFKQTCDSSDYVSTLITFVFATLTGMLGGFNAVNPVTWFQTVFYLILMIFPPLDGLLRRQTRTTQGWLLGVFGAISSFAFIFIFSNPSLIILNFTILTWIPLLITGMLMAYFFQPAVACSKRRQTSSMETLFTAQEGEIHDKIKGARLWGVLSDIMSIILLAFEVIVVLSPDCLLVTESTFLDMRPGETLPEETQYYGDTQYVKACDVTYDEFVDFIHSDPDDIINNGRWITDAAGLLGFLRLGTPIVMLWLFSISFGHGFAAQIMRSKVMTRLAPLAYPLYLLHGPIARFYWIATRGLKPEFWWENALTYPFPVMWYECWIIILICLVLAFLIDISIMPRLMPLTIRVGVKVCSIISSCCKCGGRQEDSALATSTAYEQVEATVKGLTGAKVSRSMDLRHLGLDSLGATALLSTLHAEVPSAKNLTMQQLAEYRTVGELVDSLDASATDVSDLP